MTQTVRADLSSDDSSLAELRFSYNQDTVKQVKTILGSKWVPKKKIWTVPIISLAFVSDLTGCRISAHPVLAAEIFRLRQVFLDILLQKEDFPVECTSVDFIQAFKHQRQGVAWLQRALTELGGVLLADDVGLGKTAQSIAMVLLMAPAGKVLVACQGSDRPNWEREFRRFAPDISVTIVKGSPDERAELWKSSGVLIASHDILARDVLPKKWDLIIRDEATAFKNPRAQRTKAVMKLKAKYRLDLTGTPIENALEELRTLMDWLQPGLLGNEWQFKQRFCVTDFWGNTKGYRYVDEVKTRFEPFYIRRVSDVEYPPSIDRYIEMAKDEEDEYRKIRDDFLDWAELSGESGAALQARLIRLRQFVSHPPILGYDEAGAKFRSFKDLYQQLTEAEHRILLFTYFRPTAEFLADEFKCDFIEGGMSPEQKDSIIQDFNAGKGRMLVATDSIQKGKNIQSADVLVHWDALWNPAGMHQREGRIRRIGQEKPTKVFNLIVADSIDERVYKLLYKKSDLSYDMLGTPIMSRKDWMELVA